MEGVWLVGAEASNHYRGKQKKVHAGPQPTHHFNNKVIKPKVLLEQWFPKNRPIKVSQQLGIEHCKSKNKSFSCLCNCSLCASISRSSPGNTLKGLLMQERSNRREHEDEKPIIWDRFTMESVSSSKTVLGCDSWLLKLEDKYAYVWFYRSKQPSLSKKKSKLRYKTSVWKNMESHTHRRQQL